MPSESDAPNSLQAVVTGAQIPRETLVEVGRYAREGAEGKSDRELERQDREVDIPAAQSELRGLWGSSYDERVKNIDKFLGVLPEATRDLIARGRDTTGKALGNDPSFLQRLVPLATADRPDISASMPIDEQLRRISDFRRENRPAYDKADWLQARERELISAQLAAKAQK